MNFGHQQDHQPITCSAECFPTYQETPYIKREKIESVNIILKLQTRKENFQVRFQTDRASMSVYMRYGEDLGESSQNKSEKRHKAFYYSQRPVIRATSLPVLVYNVALDRSDLKSGESLTQTLSKKQHSRAKRMTITLHKKR